MNIITERMLWADMLTQEEYDATYIPAEEYLDPSSYTDDEGNKHLYLKDGFLEQWTAEMNILPESPVNSLYKYPHFVEYVIDQVQTFMLRKQGTRGHRGEPRSRGAGDAPGRLQNLRDDRHADAGNRPEYAG